MGFAPGKLGATVAAFQRKGQLQLQAPRNPEATCQVASWPCDNHCFTVARTVKPPATETKRSPLDVGCVIIASQTKKIIEYVIIPKKQEVLLLRRGLHEDYVSRQQPNKAC